MSALNSPLQVHAGLQSTFRFDAAMLCLLQQSDHPGSRHKRKALEEIVDRLACWEIIKPRLHGLTGAAENRRATHHVGRANKDRLFQCISPSANGRRENLSCRLASARFAKGLRRAVAAATQDRFAAGRARPSRVVAKTGALAGINLVCKHLMYRCHS